MGTPEFSVPSLQALLMGGYFIASVYTQPPRPKDRGHRVQESPVHKLAIENDIPVYTPTTLRSTSIIESLEKQRPTLIIVVAYGCLLPKEVLSIPKLGCWNVHASLLPRWRGAAPIHHALLSGDTETGTTLMQMDEGLDTGPVFSFKKISLTSSIQYDELYTKLSYLGASNLMDVLRNDDRKSVPQPLEGVTLAPKIVKEDGILDPRHFVVELDRKIRALNPTPGTWIKDLKILKAKPIVENHNYPIGSIVQKEKHTFALSCSDGFLVLECVQSIGGKKVSASSWIQGNKDRLNFEVVYLR